MPISFGRCPAPYSFPNSPTSRCQSQVPDNVVFDCKPYVKLSCIPLPKKHVKPTDGVNLCAPKDHLDRALSACYDQHRQWWAPRAQTVMQCATYRLFPWGQLQYRICRLRSLGESENLRIYNHERCDDVSHMKCSIGSPHISNTDRGFARPGLDGLFYNC